MSEKRDRLIFLLGTLFSKSQALNVLLRELAESNECQGELSLTCQNAEGQSSRLVVYIDGTEVTIMPDDRDADFRLDISNQRISLE